MPRTDALAPIGTTTVRTDGWAPSRDSADGATDASDVKWDGRLAATALLTTLFAGVVAGLMGVGGGIVLGPLMLQLGMLPQVRG